MSRDFEARSQLMYHVYVLANPDNRIYIGQTDNLDRRMFEHNDPEYTGSLYTKRHSGPWRLLHFESYPTRTDALKREKQLKSSRGRSWIRVELLP